jgi:flagellar biosynthesis anti-sigma factor FlgM
MKVNDSTVTNNSAYGVGKTQETEAAGQSGRARQQRVGSAASDQAEISSTAGILQSEASSRAERVEQLRDAVQSGRYQVDAEAVSKRIVEESLGAKSAGGEVEPGGRT